MTEDDIAFVEGEDEDKNDTDDNSDDGQDGDAEFEDEDNESLGGTEYEVEIDDGIEFNPGNTLGKLLACITQVQVHSYSHKLTPLTDSNIDSPFTSGQDLFCKSL